MESETAAVIGDAARQSRHKAATKLILAAVVTLLVGGGLGYVSGRITAPIHRHPFPPPSMPLLTVELSCKRAPQSPAETHSITAMISYQSGYAVTQLPAQDPSLAVVVKPISGTVTFGGQHGFDRDLLAGGFVYSAPASQVGDRWVKTTRDTPPIVGVVSAVGPYALFDLRHGSGDVMFNWHGGSGQFPVLVGFFDVDGSTLIKERTVSC
jgi:hypothetical protein